MLLPVRVSIPLPYLFSPVPLPLTGPLRIKVSVALVTVTSALLPRENRHGNFVRTVVQVDGGVARARLQRERLRAADRILVGIVERQRSDGHRDIDGNRPWRAMALPNTAWLSIALGMLPLQLLTEDQLPLASRFHGPTAASPVTTPWNRTASW